MTSTREASCSCGALTITTPYEPLRVTACHCLACQKRTGSAVSVQARFALEDVNIQGESSCYKRVADSGNEIDFYFCPQCGTTVYYLPLAMSDFIAVPIGGFADPNFPAPSFSIYETRKHAWLEMGGEIEHYD